MKGVLVSIALALLISSIIGCGATSKAIGPGSASDASTTGGKPEVFTTTPSGLAYDEDDRPIRFYGHEAGPMEGQAITALVKSYYAAAANGDGAKACLLIHSLIAEAIPEDYEQPALRGKTCAVVMSKLFRQRHLQHDPESATPKESATLKVISIRVQGGRALVLLRFADAHEPNHIAVHLEGDTWKIWELFGIHMP